MSVSCRPSVFCLALQLVLFKPIAKTFYTFAYRRLRALAGIADQAQGLAIQEGVKIRQKEGALAGAKSVKRDEEGNIKPPELKDDFSVFGQSFNRSAILAHQAQIEIDNKEELDRIQRDFESDPEGFRNATKAFKAQTLKGMPEELAVIVGQDYDKSVSRRLGMVNDSFFKKEKERQAGVFSNWLESFQDDITNAARAGDEDAVKALQESSLTKINQAIEEGLINPQKAETIKESVAERVEQQKALKQIDDVVFNEELSLEDQVKKGQSFFEQLKSNPPKDLSAEQNEALRSVVGSKVNGLIAELAKKNAEVSIEKQKQISDVEVLINTGAGDPEKLAFKVEELHTTGFITRKERTSLLTKLNNKQKEHAKNAVDFTKVAQKLSGNFPEIVISQKEANQYYDKIVEPQLEGRSTLEVVQKQAEFVEKLKVVPNKMKAQMANNILSGDADLIRQTADFVDRIEEVHGLPEIALSANDRAFIDIVNSLDNIDPSEAVDIARKQTDPTNKARLDVRSKQIIEEKWETGGTFGDGYADKVKDIDAFETFFGSSLITEVNMDQMTKEYKDEVENLYKAGFAKDAAYQKAEKSLVRNWGESQFGFMKNRPEDYYQVNSDNPEWMKDQLVEELNNQLIGGEGFSISKDQVFLQSDDETQRLAAKGEPTYRIIVIDEYGTIKAPVLSDENGNPSNRWMPDVTKEEKRLTEESKDFADKVRGRASSKNAPAPLKLEDNPFMVF